LGEILAERKRMTRSLKRKKKTMKKQLEKISR